MDFNQLEVLVAVVQEKGFSRAGDRLQRSQPAISQAIHKLEAELGEQILDRSSKEGALTAYGQVLYRHALHLLNVRNDAEIALRELRDLKQGKLVIGANEYTVTYILPALKVFRLRHPHIQIDVKRSMGARIPSEVLSHEFELGVVSYRPTLKGLKIVPAAVDETVLIVAPDHELAGRAVVSVKDLGAESFVAQSVPSPYRDRTIQAFERFGTPANITLELPTLEAIKRAVENKLGIAFVPKLTAQAELDRGTLVALKVREIQLQRRLHLIYREGSKPSHAARAFLGLIQKRQ